MGQNSLTVDGKRVLKMLVEQYGMTEQNAIRLMKDGGTSLAIALLRMMMR